MEQTLYGLCDGIMYWLADVFGISYEAACVYGNLYFEALLCVVSCLTLFIPFMRRWKRTGMDAFCVTGILSMLGYTSGVAKMWLKFLSPYIGKSIMAQYNLCVSQMLQISHQWGMTYKQVNLIYFVIPEVALLAFNIFLFIKLNRLAKKNFGTQYFMNDVQKKNNNKTKGSA